jgi:hypothetical protein
MPAVGRLCSLAVAIVVCAAALPPACAGPADMQRVADPKGRFTISFPSDWRVVRSAEAMPAVLGAAPAPDGEVPATVNVVVEDLPLALSAQGYAQAAGRLLRDKVQGFAPIKEGATSIAGRPAYYRYYTWRANTGSAYYELQLYVTVQKRGFQVTGTTLYEAQRMRKDVPTLTLILQSFRPTEVQGHTTNSSRQAIPRSIDPVSPVGL